MKTCELLTTCPFFNDVMIGMPLSSQLLKNRHCRADNTRCARYMVFKALGREHVPPTLFPDDIERAEEIIRAALAQQPQEQPQEKEQPQGQ